MGLKNGSCNTIRCIAGATKNEEQRIKLIGITEQNLSILKSGKARAIRFNTLQKICEHLNCQPGDILVCKVGAEQNDF